MLLLQRLRFQLRFKDQATTLIRIKVGTVKRLLQAPVEPVVSVGRPAFGQENSTVTIFKVQPNGEAIATKVKLGVASVNTIQVLEGLNPGDQVILSDMSQYDSYDRVQLKG